MSEIFATNFDAMHPAVGHECEVETIKMEDESTRLSPGSDKCGDKSGVVVEIKNEEDPADTDIDETTKGMDNVSWTTSTAVGVQFTLKNGILNDDTEMSGLQDAEHEEKDGFIVGNLNTNNHITIDPGCIKAEDGIPQLDRPYFSRPLRVCYQYRTYNRRGFMLPAFMAINICRDGGDSKGVILIPNTPFGNDIVSFIMPKPHMYAYSIPVDKNVVHKTIAWWLKDERGILLAYHEHGITLRNFLEGITDMCILVCINMPPSHNTFAFLSGITEMGEGFKEVHVLDDENAA